MLMSHAGIGGGAGMHGGRGGGAGIHGGIGVQPLICLSPFAIESSDIRTSHEKLL